MTVLTHSIQLKTQGHGDVLDITSKVVESVAQSGLDAGLVTVFSPSATSGITTLEYETGCIKDLKRLFDEMIPPDRDYAHNMRWGDGNGHSHIRAALVKPSLTIPFSGGKVILGTWQSIILVDFDNRPRNRELVLQIMGE